MAYVVKVDNDYIAEGDNYIVQGLSYVPITSRITEAKVYSDYNSACRGSNRKGENMRGSKICVIHLGEYE